MNVEQTGIPSLPSADSSDEEAPPPSSHRLCPFLPFLLPPAANPPLLPPPTPAGLVTMEAPFLHLRLPKTVSSANNCFGCVFCT